MPNSIGVLAANELIAKANHACKKTALSLQEVGKQLNVYWHPDAPWNYLQELCKAVRPHDDKMDGILTLGGLAERQLHSMMSKCLEKLVQQTSSLKEHVECGEERWTQYEEGLITETEYLNSLIDAVSRH